ncbi:MAG TPA: hypothetical protein PLH02_06200 [Bacillota bacterium]|nr:hypothetical protein [Bacillota bacterium]
MTRKKRNLLPIVSLLVALLFVVSLAVTTYGWIVNYYSYSQDVLGKSGALYFADGDGSSSDPFIISEPNHFYNLAYLQNIGAFGSTTYYFKVADPDTGLAITIDFSDPSYLSTYQTV